MTETTFVKGDLQSDSHERKLKSALQNEAYALAFEVQSERVRKDVSEIDTLRAKFARVEGELEATRAALARPQTLNATLKAPAKPKPAQKRADVGKAIANAATAEFLRFAKQTPVSETLTKLYPSDGDRFARGIASKMLTTTATTAAAGWAAELTRRDVLGFWRAQEATSIVGSIVAQGYAVPLQFGPNASLSVPTRDASGDGSMRAHWIAENGTIPVAQDILKSVAMNRHKLACISAFSNELAETSTPNIAAVIEDSVLTDTSVALDQALISNDASVAGKRPAGLLNGITALTSSGIVDDLKALLLAMAQFRARRPFIVMDAATHLELLLYTELGQFVFRDEMRAGSILGVPFIVSSNIDGKLAIIDGAALFLAVPVPQIDVSASATIAMASADGAEPTMADKNIEISDAAGTTPPTEVRSMLQTNATAIRTIYPDVSWALISKSAAAWLVPSW